MKRYRNWCCMVLFMVIFAMSVGVAIVAVADPYFHYHAPLKNARYDLGYERYTNDGILKRFSYDALITGTSVTENFKVSEMNDLFGVNAVKVPFSGATYKEINDNLEKAGDKEELKCVIRALDLDFLVMDKNAMHYTEAEYPRYLYDDYLLNDTSYVLNKTAVLKGVEILIMPRGMEWEEEFDKYENWNDKFPFGKEHILKEYKEPVKSDTPITFSQSDREILMGNLEQNVFEFVEERQDVTFYLFFPPYSIYWWNTIVQEGKLDWEMEAQRITIEELLKYDNVKMYTFSDKYEMITNLDNYRDDVHYGEWINSDILKWMKNEEYLLTKDNYINRLENMKNYYKEYDYKRLFD